MNLHGIVRGAIGTVNPHVPAQMLVPNGTFTTSPAGKKTPAYNDPVDVSVQLQPLSYTDLKQVDGLNLQGILRAAYVNGNFEGVNRLKGKGGDKLLVNGETWLIVQPLEEWPDWCKFVVTLQVVT